MFITTSLTEPLLAIKAPEREIVEMERVSVMFLANIVVIVQTRALGDKIRKSSG